eukprot:g732.t1
MLHAMEEKEIPASSATFIRPNLTKVEQQEYLRLERSLLPSLAVAGLATGIEVAVNTWFSLGFFEQQRLEQTMAWATKHSDLSEGRLRTGLARAAWVSVAVFVAIVLLAFGKYGVGLQALALYGLPLLQSAHLCALWLWMSWVLRHASTKLIAEARAGEETGQAALRLLRRMRGVSSLWANNHAVRLITTTVIATAWLAAGEYQRALTGYETDEWARISRGFSTVYFTFAIVLYLIVWVTAAAPGYVTDKLFSGLLLKLSQRAEKAKAKAKAKLGKLSKSAGDSRSAVMRLASAGDDNEDEEKEKEEGWDMGEDEDDEDAADADDSADCDDGDDGKHEEEEDDDELGAAPGPGKRRHWQYYREEEKEVTRLMQRLNSLRGIDGMHFAFVPMTLARAVTVGTVLGYTVLYTVKYTTSSE